MALTSGAKLGPYEILSPLGAGGMGEVYRARDTKLNREVALKVLPPAMARDVERMARFQREAQVLASLNHPNIAAIYGLEESSDVRALVMELVEGPTLAELLENRNSKIETRKSGSGLPTNFEFPSSNLDLLGIAKQIAEALEAAHEKGIVHRDLKPANIKVTPDGTVKVLDFGLAKAIEEPVASGDSANSPTLSGAATRAGVIMGTAAYMAPEQARSHAVDRRADIWSFGVVLFEMLTGKQAFQGESTSDILASVLKFDPDWGALPASTPPSVVNLLRRCLTKDRKQRLQAIGEARIALEATLSPGPDVDAASKPAPEVAPWPRAAKWVAVAILICLAGLSGMLIESRRATTPPRWSGDLLGGSSVALFPRVSPDGHTLAFQAMVDNQTQVAVMNPDSGNWNVLTHDRSHGLVGAIAWSRDGSRLYFDRYAVPFANIFTVSPLGGEERLFLKDAGNPEILPDGSLLVTHFDVRLTPRIYHYWPDSGRLQPMHDELWQIPGGVYNPPRVFPDGKEAVFFGTVEGTGGSPNLYVLDIASAKTRRLAPNLTIPPTTVAFPLAPTPDNRSVLIDLPSGSLHQIVAVPRSGSGPVQVLLTLSTPPWLMDCGPDGSIYIDQVERPLQLLEFPVSGGAPEVIAASETYPPALMQPVAFPDGSILLPALLSGHARLLLGKPNGNFFPLVDAAEESGPPAALLPDNQVAFIAATGSSKAIAIASAGDGKIIRRIEAVKGEDVKTLAASPDGNTLYYTMAGNVWAVPAADGPPRKICAGDGVAVDPNGKDLCVERWGSGGKHLFRVPLSGGSGDEIRIPNDLPLNHLVMSGTAIRQDGNVLVGVQTKDSWFFSLAVADPASAKLTRVPLNYTGDILLSGWTKDGRIMAFGEPMRSRIWRFRPIQPSRN